MGIGSDLRGRRRDGSEFPVEISLSPIRTERGVRTVAAVREIVRHRAGEEPMGRALDAVVQRSFRAGLALQAVLNRVDDHVAPRIVDVLKELDDIIRDARATAFNARAQHSAD